MPPKKQGGGGPSKKTIEKKKEKIVEDKTFGLKNKKGKKQQQFIKQVTQQVKYGNQGSAKREQEERDKRLQKKEKEREKLETDMLFKPVQSQKVSAGADPKSVLCAFFKQGLCKKGDKCKFSHDLSIERKSEKRSLYVDAREELEKDTMDTWDQQKLEEVVGKKHGQENQGPKKTEIVCKHFLDAIDKGIYGWFWTCPNGGDKCHYRHALPPSFVLKKDRKKEAQEDQITIEELVEEERAALGGGLTKITLETFLEWKQRKLKEKKDALAAAMAKKKADFKAGKMLGVSGREMFQFNPEMAHADDSGDEGGEVVFARREDSDTEEGAEDAAPDGPSFDLTNVGAVAETVCPDLPAPGVGAAAPMAGGAAAAAAPMVEGAAAAAACAVDIDEELFSQEVAVDEDLFEGQDLGDLDLEDAEDDEDS